MKPPGGGRHSRLGAAQMLDVFGKRSRAGWKSNTCSKPSSYTPRSVRYLYVSIDPSIGAVTGMPCHICRLARPHCPPMAGQGPPPGVFPKEEARKDRRRRRDEPGPFSLTRVSHHPSGTAVSQQCTIRNAIPRGSAQESP